MNTELFGVILMFILTLVLAIPLGKYIAKVYGGEKSMLDFFAPLENFFFRISGIDAKKEMNWKESMVAMLTINLVWFLLAMFILMCQGWLPMNPDGNPSMTPDLAFNTAISFVTNTNLQDYAGETGATYFTQLFCFVFLQFMSAATGLACAAVVFNALKDRTTDKLGNFYNYFMKSLTRILLPLSVVVAIIFMLNGMPMTFEGKQTVMSLLGDTMQVSTGPVAAMIPIKHVGTNGGGYFGANSAHPFENPNYFTNIIEMVAQFIVPLAMVFALGYYLRRKKLAWMIFGVMTVGFLCLVIPNMIMEQHGNPNIAKMGIDMSAGNNGRQGSALWHACFCLLEHHSLLLYPTGSVNSFHDSFMPLSGMNQMLAMMVNGFYGGCGVGLLNFYIFIIIAVFISGLMVGRTPEFLGKKIEAKEMKIAVIVTLVSAIIIKGGTALAAHLYALNPHALGGWLNNPGYHGFTEMLYQFTSSNANNGSGFEGLGDNTPFWNISAGFAMILGRYIYPSSAR